MVTGRNRMPHTAGNVLLSNVHLSVKVAFLCLSSMSVLSHYRGMPLAILHEYQTRGFSVINLDVVCIYFFFITVCMH